MAKKETEAYLQSLIHALKCIDYQDVKQVSDIFKDKIKSCNQIFMIGNGGSSATPSHSAGDFSKELGARTLCLTDNTPSVTAWANDTDYKNIFVGQLETFMDSGDLVLGYSGSGNSKNVIEAMKFAKDNGGETIGITGNYNNKGPGEIEKYSDTMIYFQTESMEQIEDLHLIFNHIVKEDIKLERKSR